MCTSANVRVVFGAMTIAGQVNKEQSLTMLRACMKARVGEWDSAVMYPNKETPNATNKMLGEIFQENKEEFADVQVTSKASHWISGSLSRESVRNECESSFDLLGRKMAIFYLHAPDNKTPIEETLAEIDALHKENKFDEFGLSNYASWQVAEIVYLCKQRGYVLPTVYQGPYNVFCRTIEPELLPCIRRLNMRFLAYNATAGGLLTGKYEKVDEKPSEGRFKNPMYQDRYWKKENFDAVERLKSVCASHNIAPADAAHRWLVRHSQLDAAKGDGVIIGASKLSHLEQNVAACRRADPLPEAVLLEIEAANASIKDQFRYFRT